MSTTKPGEPLNYDNYVNVDGWILPDFSTPEFRTSYLDGLDRIATFSGIIS
jgi:hypothetical protein